MKYYVFVVAGILALFNSNVHSLEARENTVVICPPIQRDLSLGVEGEDVVQLQSFLRARDDFNYFKTTSFYGAVTEQAVQKFQCREMSICSGSPDTNGYGVVGPKTRETISRVCTASASQPLSVFSLGLGTQTGLVSSDYILNTNLYRGLYNEDVKKLQRVLRSSGDYTYPIITGFYGAVTEQAVQKFQCREMSICSGSPDTNGYGVVGPQTRAVIATKGSVTQTSSSTSVDTQQINNGGIIPATTPVEPSADMSPVPIEATASKTWKNYIPANTLDSSRSTYWNSGGRAPQWIEFNFNQSVTFEKISFRMYQPVKPEVLYTTYEIYAGATQQDMELVKTIRKYSSNSDIIQITLENPVVNTKFVRLNITDAPGWIALNDVKFNAEVDSPVKKVEQKQLSHNTVEYLGYYNSAPPDPDYVNDVQYSREANGTVYRNTINEVADISNVIMIKGKSAYDVSEIKEKIEAAQDLGLHTILNVTNLLFNQDLTLRDERNDGVTSATLFETLWNSLDEINPNSGKSYKESVVAFLVFDELYSDHQIRKYCMEKGGTYGHCTDVIANYTYKSEELLAEKKEYILALQTNFETVMEYFKTKTSPDAQNIPTMVVFGHPTVLGTAAGSLYDNANTPLVGGALDFYTDLLPVGNASNGKPLVDWLGFDCYLTYNSLAVLGQTNPCSDDSVRTIFENFSQNITSAQKLFVVPDASFGRVTQAEAQDTTIQNQIINRLDLYKELVDTNNSVIAVLPYIYQDSPTLSGNSWWGMESLPLVKGAYEQYYKDISQ